MKVTTISYEMKRSNGNYGSDGVSLSAELTEGEDPIEAQKGLKLLADYQLNGERRETEAGKQIELLADEASTEIQKERANRYLTMFEEWITKVEDVRTHLRQ